MDYYTSLIALSWLALLVLSVLVKENDRLQKSTKRVLFMTYATIAIASLAEWLGVRFNGDMSIPAWVLRGVKFLDYVLTPCLGAILSLQFRRKSLWIKLSFSILCVNLLLQTVSLFTNWMLIIDESNTYSHGVLYPAYVAIYLTTIFLFVIEFATYGSKFRRQNRISLYATILFIIAGIVIQEASGGQIRTAYIVAALGMALMFIHYSEFSQIKADDRIQEQMIAITIDPLTGVCSRYAYARALNDYSETALPDTLVAFSIDINGLKSTNDAMGHTAGDELIKGAADCISRAFESYGTCYRTGGDEFIVLAEMEREKVFEVMGELDRQMNSWHGQDVPSLSLASGFACAADHPDITIEKLIVLADQGMYAAKDLYYKTSGKDRRNR